MKTDSPGKTITNGTIFHRMFGGENVPAPIVSMMKSSLEAGILASLGVRHYDKLAYEFLGDSGFSATLPFAGLRGIVAIATGMDGGGWTIGLHGFIDTDLLRKRYSYLYETWSLFSDDGSTVQTSHIAGRWQYGGVLAFGATF